MGGHRGCREEPDFQEQHVQGPWGSSHEGRRDTQCGWTTASKGVRIQTEEDGDDTGAREVGLARYTARSHLGF